MPKVQGLPPPPPEAAAIAVVVLGVGENGTMWSILYHRNLATEFLPQEGRGTQSLIPSAPENCTLSRNFLRITGVDNR